MINLRDEIETSVNIPPTIKQKSMPNFLCIPKLEEVTSKLATFDGISIRTITNSKFIRESMFAKYGKSLPKCESIPYGLQ
jgi:hypothetical protein